MMVMSCCVGCGGCLIWNWIGVLSVFCWVLVCMLKVDVMMIWLIRCVWVVMLFLICVVSIG